MGNLVKILFRLKIEDGYPPVGFESLWGFHCDVDSYVVDNVPYYIYGVSKGDTIFGEMIDGEVVASSIMKRGGHSTLRVFADAHTNRDSLVNAIEKMGAKCSRTEGLSLFSIDIPPDVDLFPIDNLLSGRSDGENFAYEDACLQHGGLPKSRIVECGSLATIPLKFN
jgi:hypothetical protein